MLKKGPKLPNMTKHTRWLPLHYLDFSNACFVMYGMRIVKALIEINFKIWPSDIIYLFYFISWSFEPRGIGL
jgi:hypothetical protein